MEWSPEAYRVENTEEIDSPALLVYPDLIAQNIRRTLAMVNPKRGTFLRPHVKTHKTPQIVRMMMDVGIDRFKCSTIAEAEMLGQAGAADVLLAYQPTAPKVARLAKLRKKFPDTTFSCLVDNQSTAETLSERFADLPLPVFLDLNVGMHRTGVSPEAAPLLYEQCRALSGIQVVGIHAYDGHIHATDVQQRKQEADAAFALVGQVLNVITPHQGNALTLVVGGSPTFPFHARREGVECSPGTFPLWDAGYAQAFPDLEFVPAALLLSRVISVIDGQQLCLDVGSKAVAADAAWPRLVFPDHPEAEALRQSEEHLVVRVPDTSATRVGDVWWGVPLHICPTVNLYESLHVVQDHQWVEDWEVTARQRKITI